MKWLRLPLGSDRYPAHERQHRQRRLPQNGFDSETVTGHGFRATARTITDELLGIRVDIIEHQLAHVVKDPNGRAYNRTAFLEQRRQMMQTWADYLDALKAGAKVLPFKKKTDE